MKIILALLVCALLIGCNTMPLNFKFVTSGANADNVPVFSQVLNGNSLKPLAPSNVKGSRDAFGNLLIEWTRRSRIAPGLRPNSDVPLAEERAYFNIEIYSGSTLKRTLRVPANEPEIPIWDIVSNPLSTITTMADGSVHITEIVPQPGYALLMSRQVFRSDDPETIISFTGDTRIDLSGTSTPLPLLVGLVSASTPTGSILDGSTGVFIAGFALRDPIAFSPTTRPVIDGALLGFDLPQLASTRLAIQITNGNLKLFQDATSGYASSPILGSRRMDMGDSYKLVVQHRIGSLNAGDVMTVTSPVIVRGDPSGFYSASDQVADFGSTQSAIKVRVYQVSAVVGRGPYTEATL